MNVTLLPSSVPGTAAAPQYLTSFLVNDTLAIDAGSLGFYATPDEQARVRHLLLTHSHIDHLASLPIFVDNVYQAGPGCVTVHASEAVLDCLRRDVFNDRLWPDFVALSGGQSPFLKLEPLRPGRPVELDGVRFTPVELNHPVPTFGYLIEDAAAAVVLATDTGPSEEIWRRANAAADLRAVFLEATFPNTLRPLAELSGHLTPELFAAELAKLTRPVPAFAIHLKPRFRAEVAAELAALGRPDVAVCRGGQAYRF